MISNCDYEGSQESQLSRSRHLQFCPVRSTINLCTAWPADIPADRIVFNFDLMIEPTMGQLELQQLSDLISILELDASSSWLIFDWFPGRSRSDRRSTVCPREISITTLTSLSISFPISAISRNYTSSCVFESE